jgi:hypothetical protein
MPAIEHDQRGTVGPLIVSFFLELAPQYAMLERLLRQWVLGGIWILDYASGAPAAAPAMS